MHDNPLTDFLLQGTRLFLLRLSSVLEIRPTSLLLKRDRPILQCCCRMWPSFHAAQSDSFSIYNVGGKVQFAARYLNTNEKP
ncbi:hypothetical protein ANTPLA_LOCUS3740 [Anthophora plagiata]